MVQLDFSSSDMIDEFSSEMELKCENKTNNNEKMDYNNIMNSLNNTMSCIKNMMNRTYMNVLTQINNTKLPELNRTETTILPNTRDITKDGNLTILMNNICQKKNKLFACIEPFSISLNPCLYANEVEQKDDVLDTINRIYDYICENDSEHIFEFILEDGIKCVTEQMEDLLICGTEMFINYEIDQIFTNENNATENCQDIRDFHECSMKELKECKHDGSAKLINKIFEIILDENCQIKTKKEINSASLDDNQDDTDSGISSRISHTSSTLFLIGSFIITLIAKFITN